MTHGLTTAEYLGWVATAVFTASYFFTRAEALRRVQMMGAVLWMVYGVLIGASPVIASNALVLAAAAWTTMRGMSTPLSGPVPSQSSDPGPVAP